MRRSRRATTPTPDSLEKVETSVSRSAGRRAAPKRARRGGVSNVVIMTLATGLVATVALPAYAFVPGSTDATFGASASSQATKAGAQAVEVGADATTVTVAREGFTATSPEEIEAAAAASAAAAAAETARVAAASQRTSYASAYTGPSAAEFLADPNHPAYDLQAVFNKASEYQGTPYVYGGATPAGFDCSGLVKYVFAQFGVSMPHSSNGQAAMGTRISEADAVPGDLVVMPGHIGFYAGNGNMLHAPYEGQNVRTQPIWSSDYHIVRIGI